MLNFIVIAPGSNIHLQLIGSSARLPAFVKTMRPYDSYGINYYNTKMSQMNVEVFRKVIKKFTKRVRSKKNRNVLLLMDNFSGHDMPADKINVITYEGGFRGFQFQNVHVLFLPPNVTCVSTPRSRRHFRLQSPLQTAAHCLGFTIA